MWCGVACLYFSQPHGTVTHIAIEANDPTDEEENDETRRDGPALTSRFSGIGGMVATGGVLYMSDQPNHRIRKLYNGVVRTLAGTGVSRFRDGRWELLRKVP